jgi:hypothetical protein
MRLATLVAALGFALASATASAQSVTYDYDRSADFSKVRTYTWAPGVYAGDEFTHRRIVAAIDSQLAVKGLRKVDARRDADVLVAYGAALDEDVRIDATSSAWGAWRVGNRTGSAPAETIVNGTLVLALVDARTEAPLWRGMARKEIDVKASPEKRDRSVNKAVEKLLEHLPTPKTSRSR